VEGNSGVREKVGEGEKAVRSRTRQVW